MSKKKKIPEKRKQSFQIGTILVAVGFILFLSIFVMGFANFGRSRISVGATLGPGFIGMILIIIGQTLRKIGRKGLAGSGLILDMEQEREDMEPVNRMRGGQINDTLEEVNLKSHLGTSERQVIKIRCTKCKYLNDEKDKFCGNCGSKI